MFAGVALGSTSLFAAFTAAPLAATDIGASRAWSGVPAATSVVGTAAGSAILAWIMARRGRRAGLSLGWLTGTAGAILSLAGVQARSLAFLLVGMVLIGIGHAANQLSRFAAADMHPAERRAAVLGWIVWAATIGAALGPSLLPLGRAVAAELDLSPATAGFAVAVVFYAGAFLCGLFLRPDPSDLAEHEATHPTSRIALGEMMRASHVVVALVVLVASQAAMVLIMTMTPVHVREHGHDLGVIGLVMSSHLMGMYAFAPLVGKLVGRAGSLRVSAVGLGVLLVAALGAAVTPGHSSFLVGLFLFLLGFGFCLGFVAGSALLSIGLAYSERVRLQGSVDAIVWTASAVASLSSGVLLATFGYSGLSILGALSVLGPLFLVVVRSFRSAAESPV